MQQDSFALKKTPVAESFLSFLNRGTYIAILPVNDVFKLPICIHYVPDMGL